MSFVSEYFDAMLTARLRPADANLPLSDAASADLLNLLSEPDSYTYLSIKSDSSYEVVKARKEGSLIIIDRGQEGTEPSSHMLGACVSAVSPLTLAVIKDLVCSYECCEGGCPCNGAEYAGSLLPDAYGGIGWEGAVVFKGDLPMTITVDGAPSWMKVVQEGSVVKLSGTPANSPGAYDFSVAAANCNGTVVATKALKVVVSTAAK